MANEYIIDFAVKGQSDAEHQASFDIIADNVEMAETIFYDALSQTFPQEQYILTDVGTYEDNR